MGYLWNETTSSAVPSHSTSTLLSDICSSRVKDFLNAPVPVLLLTGESVTPSLVSSHEVLETGEIGPTVVGVSMLAVDALRGEWGVVREANVQSDRGLKSTE